MQTGRYSTQELLEDAQGYGRVFFVARGGSLVHGSTSGSAAPRLAGQLPLAFLDSLYAFVETNRKVTLYRWYDEDPASQAKRVGSWWSPHRPSAEIDQTYLASLHKTARSDLALKRSWNVMHSVIEADLSNGTQAYVGRIARQLEPSGEALAGGFIQFYLPPWSRACLRNFHDHHWIK